MKSAWIVSVANQLVGAIVQLAALGVIERQTVAPEGDTSESKARSRVTAVAEARTSASTVKVVAFLIASLVLGSWAFGSLGSMSWWLVTGRGPGGRLLAASAVTPRHYNFRNRRATVL